MLDSMIAKEEKQQYSDTYNRDYGVIVVQADS
jgi:hypothetical protein